MSALLVTEPKRRGRPPGAKNRPKPPLEVLRRTSYGEPAVLDAIIHTPDDPVEPDYSWLNEEERAEAIERRDEPASIESYTLGPVGVKVVILFRAAMSTDGDQVEVDWPQGWPIPQLNDVIRARGQAGHVRFVEYDWDAGVIKVTAV